MPKPKILLDENVPAECHDYDVFAEELKTAMSEYADVVVVGDKKPLPGLKGATEFREKHPRWSQEFMSMVGMCDTNRIYDCGQKPRDIEKRRAMERKKPTVARQEKNFKCCVRKGRRGIAGDCISGCRWLAVPPRSSADIFIGTWAKENEHIILSNDSDPELERDEKTDRILVKRPKCHSTPKDSADAYAKVIRERLQELGIF